MLVMDNSFSLMPDGLPGNDDYGTMSSWFCWAAIGFVSFSLFILLFTCFI